MTERENLIVAALRFRATKPWDILDDSMIFAVGLPDGEIGYCCIMGNAGEHHALGLYRGAKGFSTYLNLISASEKEMREIFEIMQTYDCINCDFVNASDPDLDKADKEEIKEVAKANGLKISRPAGWPVFIRMDNGHTSIGLHEDKYCADILAALNAATYAVETIRKGKNLKALGFDPDCDYPDPRGGNEIPFLSLKEDGSYKWSTIRTPALTTEQYPELEYDNPFSAARIKSFPHEGICQCRVIHLQAKVGNPQGFYSPRILLCVNLSNEMVFPIMSDGEKPDDDSQLLDGLAQFFLNQKSCPATIQVTDGRTEKMLSDFCQKTGINLSKEDNLPQLNNAWDYLMTSMLGGIF